jgi:hypothetical protein
MQISHAPLSPGNPCVLLKNRLQLKDMKRRPWPIIILALFHIFAPIGNILVNAWLAKVNFNFYLKVLLAPENRMTLIVFTLVPIAGAVLIYICKKWSYWAYIALMTIPFGYSLMSYLKSATLAMSVALVLFYFINMLVIGYFLLPAVRRLYFDPRMRWWETKPRYKADFQCQVELDGQQHWVEIKNISEGGAFLETASNFEEGTLLKIFFKDPQGVLNLDGEIVYKRNQSPIGYGFRFDKASSKQPRLRELIKKLENDGSLIQSRLPGPEDSFIGWLKSLFPSRN